MVRYICGDNETFTLSRENDRTWKVSTSIPEERRDLAPIFPLEVGKCKVELTDSSAKFELLA